VLSGGERGVLRSSGHVQKKRGGPAKTHNVPREEGGTASLSGFAEERFSSLDPGLRGGSAEKGLGAASRMREGGKEAFKNLDHIFLMREKKNLEEGKKKFGDWKLAAQAAAGDQGRLKKIPRPGAIPIGNPEGGNISWKFREKKIFFKSKADHQGRSLLRKGNFLPIPFFRGNLHKSLKLERGS